MTAIIVTYNSREHIGAALTALRVGHDEGKLDCVVVDNRSHDGTPELVEREHAWVRLIRSSQNLGFGRGCNLGANGARGRYLLFLNPDAVLHQTDLDRMSAFLDEHPKAGLVGSAIIEGPSHSAQKAGLMMTPGRLLTNALGRFGAKPWGRTIVPNSAPFETDWVCGAVMLMPKAVFHRLGGFDPRFFLYFEETDLCRRVHSAGYEIWAFGEAVAQHVGGASAAQVDEARTRSYLVEHYYTSRFYYLVKHFGWVRAVSAEVLSRLLQRARNVLRGCMRDGLPSGSRSRFKRPFLRFPSHPGESS